MPYQRRSTYALLGSLDMCLTPCWLVCPHKLLVTRYVDTGGSFSVAHNQTVQYQVQPRTVGQRCLKLNPESVLPSFLTAARYDSIDRDELRYRKRNFR